MPLNESIVEVVALTWFVKLGHEPHMAPGEPAANDVFRLPPRISICSSPKLDLSFPNLNLSSLNLDEKRDADGSLIVRQLTLLLSGELSVAAATCKDYLQVQRATIVGLKRK